MVNPIADKGLPILALNLQGHFIEPEDARYLAVSKSGEARFFPERPDYESTGRWSTSKSAGIVAPTQVTDKIREEDPANPLYEAGREYRLHLVIHDDGLQYPMVFYHGTADYDRMFDAWERRVREGENSIKVSDNMTLGINSEPETMLVKFGDGPDDIPEIYEYIVKQSSGCTELCRGLPRFDKDNQRWYASVMTAAPKMYDEWFKHVAPEESLRKLIPKGSERKAPLRYNKNKPKVSLILEMPYALKGVTRILEFGMVKYDRGNYRQPPGFNYTEMVDCLMRHVLDFMEGKDLDEDSGRPLVDHIAINGLFLSETYHRYPNADDRVFRSDDDSLVDPERRKTDTDGGAE